MPAPATVFPADLQALINAHRAPLRISARYQFAASPERLFAVLGDLEGITRFFPMIHHASVAHQGGGAGAGSERICSIRGMGKVRERVVWWRTPQGYAYRADGRFVPLRDHLGVIFIEPAPGGGSILVWRQYLRTRFGPMGWMFPVMMRMMMDRAVKNVARLA
jgi:hypothetical protein